MSPKRILFLFSACLLIAFLQNAEAGCTGSCSYTGGNWIVDSETNVWDEEFDVQQLEVTEEGSLQILRSNVTFNGPVYINGYTSWELSKIVHLRSVSEHNISISETLEIVATEVRIQATEDFNLESVNGFFFHDNGKLIVRDGDDDPNTSDDSSIIQPNNWDPETWASTTIEWMAEPNSGIIEIKNSILKHLTGETFGDNSIITNTTFIETGWIKYKGDNILYENNTIEGRLSPQYGFSWSIDYYGSNGLFQYNYFGNGTKGIFVDCTEIKDNIGKHIVRNNSFFNLTTGFAFETLRCEDTNVYNNYFDTVQGSMRNWNSNNTHFYDNHINFSSNFGIFLTGNNISAYNNIIHMCGNCLAITNEPWIYGNRPVGEARNITVQNNTITNGNYGIIVGSGSKKFTDIEISHNNIDNTSYGIYGGQYGANIHFPKNTHIHNNTLQNVYVGMSLEGTNGVTTDGENYTIEYNSINNATSYGIGVAGGLGLFYQNMTISNNYIVSNDYGLALYDGMNSLVINNVILGKYYGVELTETNGVLLNRNLITSENIGLIIEGGNNKIINNSIIGKCNEDRCEKLFFEKIGESGIVLSEVDSTTVVANFVDHFQNGAIINNANFRNFENNTLNFTKYGLHITSSNTNINKTEIYKSYNSIKIIDAEYLSINEINAADFEIGIFTRNSTVIFTNLSLTRGTIGISSIDSEINVDNYENFDCSEAYHYVYFNFKLVSETNQGEIYAHQIFTYRNNINSESDNYITNSNGLSDYIPLQTFKVDNEGLSIDYNPFTISYIYNGITTEIETTFNNNKTITIFLDTISPITSITANGTLLNERNFYLNFEIIGENDLLNYDLYVLRNDGSFAEWELVGTYNDSIVKFIDYNEPVDGVSYRFKSIGRDLSMNIETKDTHDYELKVDLSPAESFFLYAGKTEEKSNDYFFSSNEKVRLSWGTNNVDVEEFTIQIYYTNFTTPYLNPDTVIWDKINEEIHYPDEISTKYFYMSDDGHYAFKTLTLDSAGNQEEKQGWFDFIVNYDPTSDRLNFLDVPERWGDDTLEIDLSKANYNLDFQLFVALESIDFPNPYFNWYSHEQTFEDKIVLNGLLDKTRYYLYAESTDLAGNIENPLTTIEYFSGNGDYGQELLINYIPLIKEDYPFQVYVDNDFDGDFEILLTRSDNLSSMSYSEYFLDVKNKTIYLGTEKGGFVPAEDLENMQNIKIEYSGVHAIFEVYTGTPETANQLNINPTNTTHVVFQYSVPKDAVTCKVQSTTNTSKGWFNQEIIEPCEKGIYEYELVDPQLDKEYFFRVMIENEFGLASYSESQSIKMEDVAKLYSTTESSENGILGMDSIIPITALVGIIMLGFGGVLLYRSKNEENFEENVTMIESKPVAKYKVEELYLIYKDGRLVKNISDVEVKTDSDIMSGMLTAINDFVQDSFNTEGDLGSIDYGNNKIVLQRGTHSYLAAVIYGETGNQFKGKMFRSVAEIEKINPTMGNWNGDAETINHVEHYLQPIIDETLQVSREMVDNYFTEKEIVMTSTYEKLNDLVKMNINLSNYSSESINNCEIKPSYNDMILNLKGIEPDIPYSFSDNKFSVGEIKPYNEIQFTIVMKLKVTAKSAVEIKMTYEQKGRDGEVVSNLEIL